MVSAVNIVDNKSVFSTRAAEARPKVSVAELPSFDNITPPYISPSVRVDSLTQQAVLQLREVETGDVVKQYPTEKELKAYSQSQAAEEAVFQQRLVELQVGGSGGSDPVVEEASVEFSVEDAPVPVVGNGGSEARETIGVNSIGPSTPVSTGDTSSVASSSYSTTSVLA